MTYPGNGYFIANQKQNSLIFCVCEMGQKLVRYLRVGIENSLKSHNCECEILREKQFGCIFNA